MFAKEIYINRRQVLAKMTNGVILFPGNDYVPMNYRANVYPFRQDSTFLYYFGIDVPGLCALLDTDTGNATLYGDDPAIEDIIWTGETESIARLAHKSGIEHVKPSGQLPKDLRSFKDKRREICYLPPYTESRRLIISGLCGLKYEEVDTGVSSGLIKAVVSQRSVKDVHEVSEMETTMTQVTWEAYKTIAGIIGEGRTEAEVAGAFEGSILQKGCRPAYPVICTVHGEILHSTAYSNRLEKGQLVLVDAGAESAMHYATDITRTYPVSGRFSQLQKEIYDIVLEAQIKAIETIKPGVPYRDVHFTAARIIATGMKQLGFMKGNIDDAVFKGAHALFFPHGIGHMIGLDVHDMEDLGENFVGYDDEFSRSDQFGTAYLRMAKRLVKGNVVTVEPGIYFIKALIEQWHGENKFRDFLNYDKIEQIEGFGGIRIEDNVVATDNGYRILGKPVPKKPDEIIS
jgi:Xaa-Pro aminopeptidase